MNIFGRISTAIERHTSAGGIGLAGATGLVASGLTDIASTLGPLLPWFFALAAIAAIVVSAQIYRGQAQFEKLKSEPDNAKTLCQSLLVLIGALFGSGVLLITSMLSGNSGGSAILAALDDIRSGVERVETQVVEVGEKVDDVGDQVSGIGQTVSVRDITGRSGTGMIGDISTFQISLANEKLMDDANCELAVFGEWRDAVEVLNDDCAQFSVQLPRSAVLDESGRSRGDIISIPFEIKVLGARGEVLGAYSESYPFYNNYRTITLDVDPPGNRFKVNERRRVKVSVDNAELSDGLQCDWALSPHLDGLSFEPDSDNYCTGWLSTELEEGSPVLRRLKEENRLRARVSVSIVTSSDFAMLGIMESQFEVSQ